MRCKTKFCRRIPTQGKTCNTCKSRIQVEKNPIGRVFRNLKSNAKRRGKNFNLSIEYFREMVIASGYMEMRGRTKDRMSIDRLDPHLGYIPGNIKIITVGENSRKKYLDYMKEKQIAEDGIIIGEEADF